MPKKTIIARVIGWLDSILTFIVMLRCEIFCKLADNLKIIKRGEINLKIPDQSPRTITT